MTDRSHRSDIGQCIFPVGETRKASHARSEKEEKGEAMAQQRKENMDKDEDGKGKYGTKMSRGMGVRQTLTKAS